MEIYMVPSKYWFTLFRQEATGFSIWQPRQSKQLGSSTNPSIEEEEEQDSPEIEEFILETLDDQMKTLSERSNFHF